MTTTSDSLLQRLDDSADSEAWGRFVELYTPMIFKWARRCGLPTDDAADLAQDVLSIVSVSIKRFEYDSQRSFRSWLKTITINQFRQLCRRRRVRMVQMGDTCLRQMPDRRTLESTWDGQYQNELLMKAIVAMKPDFAPSTWAALTELIAGGASGEEIARRHSLSKWTLYAAKSRLIRRLRSELNGLWN